MITLGKLINCKGSGRFGSCSGCGKTSDEDMDMIRVRFNCYDGVGISICLCKECKDELESKLIVEAYEPSFRPSRAYIFGKVFKKRLTDIWSMSSGALAAWMEEIYEGGYKGYD